MPAGRPTGSTSKNGAFLLNRLKDVLGKDFDPFIKMAMIASDDDHNDQFQALKELCNYIQPKLKAVEHTGEVNVTEYSSLQEIGDRVRDLTSEGANRHSEGSIPH